MSDSRFYKTGQGDGNAGSGPWESRPNPDDEFRIAPLDKSGALELTCPKVHAALELMSAHSKTGMDLYQYARIARIGFSDTGDIHGMGQYRPDFRGVKHTVLLSPENDVPTNTHVLAHEIMHSIQRFNQSAARYLNWSSRNFAAHGLAMEAGAVTAQFRVSYEMKLNGHSDAWDAQVKLDDPDDRNQQMKQKYVPIAEAFETAHRSSREEGLGESSALQIAGTAAFHAYFESQELRDIYNKKNLNSYIKVMLTGQFDGEFPSGNLDRFQTLQLTGLYDEAYLTSGPTPPRGDDELFGDNTRLRQAFDAAEIERLRRNPAAESQATCRQALAEAQADGNPYLDVDFSKIPEQVKDCGVKDLLDIMDELSGDAPALDAKATPRRTTGGPAPMNG